MATPEFSRRFDVRQAEGRTIELTASEDERKALARRFELVRIERLEAQILLTRSGDTVLAKGPLEAEIVQSCAVSAEDLPVAIREIVDVRFVPARPDMPEEMELSADELDEIEYHGAEFDLGEAVAQSLALAIDPFAAGPQADEARRKAGLLGEGDAGPFAALKGLKRDD